MKNLEKFDRVNLKTLRTDIQAALDTVGKLKGIDIKMGNIKFSEHEFRCPLNVSIAGKPKVEIDYSEIYKFLNLPKLGHQFMTRSGDRYEVIMHKPGSPKFNVVAKDLLTGKQYKFAASAIERIMKIAPQFKVID